MDSAEGAPLNLRAFLDQGSQASFITENSVQLLGLQRRKVHIKVNGLARVTETSAEVTLELGSRFDSKTRYQVHLSELKFPKCKNLSLADPSYYVPQGVNMLLGSDIYYELMLGEIYQGPVGYPLALNTRLDYNLSRNVCERYQ